MSKAPDSPPRSRSRSRSRSYSRSRSRSRSRKHRYSSRSRSRSRSHSPSHRSNYPTRDSNYHNNRGFNRGYNRGFRRPYYYNNRGRTRGFYPRGRYQRGGGSYNFRPNNWQGGGSYQHHDQEHRDPHSPRRGRSRSRTPKKRSGSRSHSRSRYSDRSSSGRSRHSRHSSYSSRSSSPRRPRSSSTKVGSKDGKDKPSEAQGEKGGSGGSGGGGGGGGGGGEGAAAEGSSTVEKSSAGKWKGLDYDASPKHGGQQNRPASGASQGPPAASDSKSPASSGSLWRTVGGAPPAKSPPESTASFGGFGFFSKEESKPAGDKTAISSAFKKFLAENKSKKQASERDNGREVEQSSSADREQEKGSSGKTAALYSISSSIAAFRDTKEEKPTPFFDLTEEEFFKDRRIIGIDGEETKPKVASTLTASRFGKWDDEAHYYSKEKSRRDADEAEADLEHMEEELYRSRKQSSKKEEKAKKKEKKEKEKARMSESPTAAPPRGSGSREKDRPLFPCAREASPSKRPSGKTREDFELKISSLDDMTSSSGAQRDRRSLSQDLAHPVKKVPEFRSIFQHVPHAHLRRSPSELFAQHIVTIVHYIKAQHFRCSGMTLSERFATYQRKAAEMEKLKPRKSPEIHRRIDVSPSAFKRHSHLFEEVEESGYKEQSNKVKGDVMDLRLDIERRKRFAAKEHKREAARGSGGSRGPSPERSSEKSAKHHKKSKKSKKRRSPSSSSSSSSPSPSFRGKEYPTEEEGWSKSRYGPRDYPGPMDRGPREHEGHMDRGPPRDYDGPMDRGRGRGFFPRVRGRGWSRGNYPGNNSNGNPPNQNAPVRPPEEEWDPEYTPKSRKYYFHDDREGEKSWVDRGRGRGAFPRSRGTFIYRKGGSSPKWTHDMFQGTEEGELGEDSTDMDQKEDKPGDASESKP